MDSNISVISEIRRVAYNFVKRWAVLCMQ